MATTQPDRRVAIERRNSVGMIVLVLPPAVDSRPIPPITTTCQITSAGLKLHLSCRNILVFELVRTRSPPRVVFFDGNARGHYPEYEERKHRASIWRTGSDNLIRSGSISPGNDRFGVTLLVQASEGHPVMLHGFGLLAMVLPLLGQVAGKVDPLQTVAERSDYRATARYDDVAQWCRDFAKLTPNAHLTELGQSAEGRSIPLLIVADPPVKTAAEAARSGKLVCLIIGNIHAGEVCGKEALPMLLREAFGGAHPPLLKDLILAVAPIYNTDGNERVSKTNRPEQVGPEEGMGQRANARGLDLNRDFIKLEAPETRALVRFLNEWNPHLFIDTHTTDGSYHRYTDYLRRAQESRRRSQDHGLHAASVFPQAERRF